MNESTQRTLERMKAELRLPDGASWEQRELRETRLLEAEQLEQMILPHVGILTRVENPKDRYEEICRLSHMGAAGIEWWISSTEAQRGLIEQMLPGFVRAVRLHLEVMALRASLKGQEADTGGAP